MKKLIFFLCLANIGHTFSEAVFVQNQLGGSSVVVDHNGKIIQIISESRLEMSERMAVTKKCIWFGNEASVLPGKPSKDYGTVAYTLSCLDRKTNQLKDYPFNDEIFGGILPVRTLDGNAVIFSSSFVGRGQWLIKIDDNGQYIKKNYSKSFEGQADFIDFDLYPKYIIGSDLFMPMTFFFKKDIAKIFNSYIKIDTNTMDVKAVLRVDENTRIIPNRDRNTLIVAYGKQDHNIDGQVYKFKLAEYDNNFKLIKKIQFNGNSDLLTMVKLLGSSKNYIYMDHYGEIMRYDYFKNKLEILLDEQKDVLIPKGDFTSTGSKILTGRYLFTELNSKKTRNQLLLILDTETKKYKIADTGIQSGYISEWNPPQ
jgi:hypothetical protein